MGRMLKNKQKIILTNEYFFFLFSRFFYSNLIESKIAIYYLIFF